MCSCHSILECCVTFSGVKLSIRSFVLFIVLVHTVLLSGECLQNDKDLVKLDCILHKHV